MKSLHIALINIATLEITTEPPTTPTTPSETSEYMCVDLLL